MLNTERSLTKFILLGIITLGIYQIVVLSKVSTDINTIASRYDYKKTPHFCLVFFLLSWLTLGIYPLIWFTQLSIRVGNEQVRRGLPRTISGTTFWGWNVLGSLIIVGPYVYTYRLLHAMNALSADYNKNMQ